MMKIRVYPTSLGMSDWGVAFADGRHMCDIRLAISSILNASRYYVVVDDAVTKEGTFNFGVWDWDTVEELLKALVHSMYADAEVTVEVPRPARVAQG